MSNSNMVFEPYELKVINEIADHIVNPTAVQNLLSAAGKPIELIMKGASKIPVVKKIPAIVNKGVSKGIKMTVKIARKTFQEGNIVNEFQKVSSKIQNYQDCIESDLKTKDFVADKHNLANGILTGVEGFLVGVVTTAAEVTPGAQFAVGFFIGVDVTSSMLILSRTSCQVAACYGFGKNTPQNILHTILSMMPQKSETDADYFTVKDTIYSELRMTAEFMKKNAGMSFEEILSKMECPHLIKLINTVSGRIGISITEKELALLIPFVGGVLNGSINVAFQRTTHVFAKDYFRRLILDEKYGKEVVDKAIALAIYEKKTQQKAA